MSFYLNIKLTKISSRKILNKFIKFHKINFKYIISKIRSRSIKNKYEKQASYKYHYNNEIRSTIYSIFKFF